MSRRHISLKVKLAAALLQMKRPLEDTGELVRVISHEEAKRLTADQIIARFHFDHFPIPHAEGGPDEPWNLDPLPVAEHQEKTADNDIPEIAKGKRIRDREAEHHAAMRRKLLEPSKDRAPPRSRWPSRPMRRAAR